MAVATKKYNDNIVIIADGSTSAKHHDDKEEEEEEEIIVLGTADYNVNTGIVNNVYVRDYARKKGLAELMMQAVESYHNHTTITSKTTTTTTITAATTSAGEKKQIQQRKPLKLTVASSNIPAISLYKKLGFRAKGAYGVLDRISSAIPALNFLMEMEK